MTLGRDVAQALERHPPVLRLHDRVALRLEHAPEELRAAPTSSSTTSTGRSRRCCFEHRHQALAVDRLGEVVGGAQRVAQVPVVDDRQHDDGDVGDLGVGLERRQHRPAVHPGHHHVQRDRVRPQLAGQSQALLAAGRGDDPEAFLVRKRRIRSRTAASSSITSTVPTPGGTRSAGVGGRARPPRPASATLGGQPDGEGAAPARLALDGDVAAHHPAEPPAHRQAETGPAVPARRGRVGLGEGLEQPRELLGRHADARVAHAEHHPVLAVGRLAGHRQRDRPALGELAGVAQEVEQGLAHLRQVRVHRADLVGAAHVQAVGVLRGQRLDHGGDVADQAGHVEGLEVQLHLAGLDLGEIEDGVDQPQQVLAGRVDLLEVVGELLGPEVGGVLLEHLAVADDGVERRAQLVGHVGQELGLVAVGGLELAALVLDLPEQPRVLDGQGRLGWRRS